MAHEPRRADPSVVSPEQFVSFVKGSDDDTIASTIRETGTEAVLETIFGGMQQRFLPDKAAGVDARIQFVIEDQGVQHPYLVTIASQKCEVARHRADDAKVTLTTDLVSFVKLITGQAQGPMLFMTRRLKISGDLMFSQRIMSYFDRPKG